VGTQRVPSAKESQGTGGACGRCMWACRGHLGVASNMHRGHVEGSERSHTPWACRGHGVHHGHPQALRCVGLGLGE
jgi:hypothetical protein